MTLEAVLRSLRGGTGPGPQNRLGKQVVARLCDGIGGVSDFFQRMKRVGASIEKFGAARLYDSMGGACGISLFLPLLNMS